MDVDSPEPDTVAVIYKFPSWEEFQTLDVVSSSSASKEGEVEIKDVLSAIAKKHGFSMDFELVALKPSPTGSLEISQDEAVQSGVKLNIIARKSFPVFLEEYDSARSFVGGFQVTPPEFQKDKKWKIRSSTTEPANDPRRTGMNSRNAWQLASDSAKVSFKGQLETNNTAKFMIFRLDADKFQATSVHSWYNFKRESTNRKLTLEEAEEQLEKKKKRQASTNFQRWLMKNNSLANALSQSETGAADYEKDEDDFDWQDNLNRKLKSKNEDEDKKAKVEKITNKGADEDWEHVENASDDDDAHINESDDEKVEEQGEYDHKQIQEEEEEQKHLSLSGKEIAKLLGASGLGSDDDESDYDDEDGVDDGDKGKQKEESGSKPNKPLEEKPNGKSETEQKKRARDSGENSSSVKKIKSQKDTSSSVENGTGPLTESELRSYLRKTGPIRIKDLLKKLKNRMNTAEEKKRFKEIFLLVAVKTKDSTTGEILAKLKK